MKNKKTHAMLLALVGGYIWYIAWQLLQGQLAGGDGMPVAVAVGAIAVFAVAGIGIFVYAWKMYREGKQEEKETADQDKPV